MSDLECPECGLEYRHGENCPKGIIPDMNDETEKAAEDAIIYGTGFMLDGKRIDSKEIYKPMNAEERAREVYDYIDLQYDEDPTFDMIDAGVSKIYSAIKQAEQEARNEALEEAARVADHMYYDQPFEIAKAIRALKEKK